MNLTPKSAQKPDCNTVTFTVKGDPMGKPRMTQRDKWQKRPAVTRYWAYCDRIRAASPPSVPSLDVYAVNLAFYIAMPDTWSARKKEHLVGTYHRSRPDFDNLCKAVCDALFDEDSIIGEGRVRKIWCREGDQRTEIKLKFNT